MAAPGKSSSVWGTFLSHAFEGVETRLDNMLADGEEGQQQGNKAPAGSKPANAAQQQAKTSTAAPRSSSSSRTNDRLQARLAKAMAAKNAPGARDASPRSSVDQASRSSMDRASFDRDRTEKNDSSTNDTAKTETKPADGDITSTSASTPRSSRDGRTNNTAYAAKPEAASTEAGDEKKAEKNEPDFDPRMTQKIEQEAQPIPPIIIENPPLETPHPQSQSSSDLEALNARQKEEIQEYAERIDSLQAKLQYLSKSAADAAKNAKMTATSGSVEQKLAEKEEKIALLMEEGQKLSTSEQKFRTSIRKLRAQMAENEKQIEELKKDKEKAAAEAETLRKRISSGETSEKQQAEARRATAALQKEIDALKKDNAAKDEALRRLEQELKTKLEQAEKKHSEALKKALSTEREKQQVLEDKVFNLQGEHELLTSKTKQETTEWQEKLDRATERNRKVESELKTELHIMESKLEAMRTATEEATSGTGGEAQAKLLRQIETLQTQYVTASENWQGVEASLLAKVATMEKEGDEAQRRESEMRKKARDAASKCRRLEDELQDVSPALVTAQQELESCREELASLKTQLKSQETALEEARSELEKQQKANSRDISVESERRQWVDDVKFQSRPDSRPESPLLAVQRAFSSDLASLPVPGRVRRAPTPSSIPDSPGDYLSSSRRLSSQPPARLGQASLMSPLMSPSPLSPFAPPSEASRLPSPPAAETEDTIDDGDPSSPRNMAHDMISVSTVGAGPSVQLVERMSAAIRRLEAEKVAAKEEMARVCSQRDEARSDMLGLMKELDTAKSQASRVSDLEEEVTNINARYQTTLELLGEKSEEVEELQADVQDVKAMYRELVERTIK